MHGCSLSVRGHPEAVTWVRVWQTAVELAATRGKLRALFVLLDEDGSGELTAEELQALGRAIGAWLLID
jgi:hypothetical protein